ncbi:MAG: hypothetical protein D6790_18375 [Caldilineae bacterium]|nr:MAG: hypothetical protein D6790_18375 [Caldilineae bacterium]
MAPDRANDNDTSTPRASVAYDSYLLRVRTVSDENGVVQHIYLRKISSPEEFYFASLNELMDFLRVEK